MLLTKKHMGKLSEASIATQYCTYLQKVMIIDEAGQTIPREYQGFLSYDEFKDYYIMQLVGRKDYIDNLAATMQRQNLIENA